AWGRDWTICARSTPPTSRRPSSPEGRTRREARAGPPRSGPFSHRLQRQGQLPPGLPLPGDCLPSMRVGNHPSPPGRAAAIVGLFGLAAGARYPSPAVFDTLSDKLQHALGDLRGRGRLDEESVSKAMREIRLALLEADVNLQVVKDFVARVKERAVGEEVTKSLTPGQEVVKIVHDELTQTMGGSDSRLAFAQKGATVILLAGLQGSGKTTT